MRQVRRRSFPRNPCQRRTAKLGRALAIGAVAIVILLICSGVFTASSNYSPTSYTPSDPYKYNDATDRDLKNLPSMSGYSDAEKERIISEAKKFDAAIKTLPQK